MFRRETDRLVMQLVIGPVALRQAEAGQRLTQFAGRETRADDGTMQVLAELPDPGAARRRVFRVLRLRPCHEPRRKWSESEHVPMIAPLHRGGPGTSRERCENRMS